MADETPPSLSVTPPPPPRFLRNLLVIAALGVAGCWWLIRYTDHFEAVGGLLALGGVFSWLAFVSKALSEERIAELQGQIDARLLAPIVVFWVALALLVVGGMATSFAGTLELVPGSEGGDRTAVITTETGKSEELTVRGAVRRVFRTSLWQPAAVTVKVAGLPAAVVTVKPWARVRLEIPRSFRHRVQYLLRPSAGCLFQIRNMKDHTLSVAFGRRSLALANYQGEAVWLGPDGDLDIAPAIVEGWRLELEKHEGLHRSISRWTRPKVGLPGAGPQVERIDVLTVQLEEFPEVRIVPQETVSPFISELIVPDQGCHK